MPWKRIDKCVYKTSKKGKKGKKEGCSDTVAGAKKYLKALYANADDISEQVDGYLSEIVLSEARFKDVKAKYAQYMGLVDSARDYLGGKLGDKGVSKYILYVMKETHRMLGEPKTKMEVLDEGKDNIIAVMFDLIDLVEKFEKNVARLKEKDIYKLQAHELEKLVDDLPTPESKEKKQRREKAQEESVRLYDDNDILVVRPLTEFASIYYGMATRWCISATECKNYFDEYTSKGKAFAMVILKNLQKVPDETTFTKVAMVFDERGTFESLFDAIDEEYYDTNDLRNAIALNHKRTGQNPYNDLDDEEQEEITDILNEIYTLASAEIAENPPDVTSSYENQIEALEEEYLDKISHAHYHASVEDGYMYFSGGFQINIDESKLAKELPGWRGDREVEREIQSMLDRELSVYVEEVEFNDEGVELRYSTSDFPGDPDGYERFLDELEDADGKFEEIVKIVGIVLKSYDYISKSDFDKFDEGTFEREVDNFFIVDSRKEVEDAGMTMLSDREPVGLTLTAQQLIDLNFTSVDVGRYYNFALSKRIVDNMNSLNRKIVAALKKQLPLPGIPQQKIEELTIPELLDTILIVNSTGNNPGPLYFKFRLSIDDLEITNENFKTIINVIKYIDKNYKDMVELTQKVIKVFLAQGLKAKGAVDKEKAAGDKLAKIDAADGTDPVNEVNDYFEELLKTELERRIEKMTIEEWLDPDIPAPWDKDYEDKK